MPAHVTAVGYTRPAGLNILAEKGTFASPYSKLTLQRYSLTGKLQKNLAVIRGLFPLGGGSGAMAGPC